MQVQNAFSAASIISVPYRIWQNSYRVGNGLVEAVVVPAIGRVMYFGRPDGASNVLWECDLDEGGHAADVEGWANYGGDKIWPAPDCEWGAVTGRPWPPPDGFDGFPHEARVEEGAVVLTSPLDPHFGIQSTRRIALVPGEPVMRISTEFRKTTGQAVRASVWAITQLRDPAGMFALLPQRRSNSRAYALLMPIPPKDIAVDGRVVSLGRDLFAKTKIGFEGSSLLWVGERETLRIDAPADLGEFPDQASRTEIYTNCDPLAYVELETLGPLVTLEAGARAEWTTTYTLGNRQCATASDEARRVFSSL